MRIAAIGDLHCTRSSAGLHQPLIAAAAAAADVLVLCGDLTDYGLEEEARILARELGPARGTPMVGVLGNHDHESGQPDLVRRILEDAGVTLLDGEGVELLGVGFAGVKGFCGGFGRRALEPWGEHAIKEFVREAVDETMKLERALARLRTRQRVAILHYSPVAGTVEGEPREIWPFLGSSRLEEPLNRYKATVAFHGHAHRGAPQGATLTGIPVYNAALPLARRLRPDGPLYTVYDLPDVPVAKAPEPEPPPPPSP